MRSLFLKFLMCLLIKAWSSTDGLLIVFYRDFYAEGSGGLNVRAAGKDEDSCNLYRIEKIVRSYGEQLKDKRIKVTALCSVLGVTIEKKKKKYYAFVRDEDKTPIEESEDRGKLITKLKAIGIIYKEESK